MLNIKKDGTDSALTMTLEGRLDTTTAPQLEEELAANLDGGSPFGAEDHEQAGRHGRPRCDGRSDGDLRSDRVL